MHAWSRSVAQTLSSAGGLVVTLRRKRRRRRGRRRAEPVEGGDVICGLSDGDRSSTKSTTGSSSFSRVGRFISKVSAASVSTDSFR